jgi:hypothetical protein
MEALGDPCNDRVENSVPAPPHKPLDPKLLYPDESKKGNRRQAQFA